MSSLSHLRNWLSILAPRILRDENAAQIVEFAIALPLLMVFVVGIFDFSAAYTLKQKLTNIARDTARIAAADPATDLANPVPASINDAFQAVDNDLVANKINDCGISITSYSHPALSSTWTFSATGNSCVLTINRGYYFPSTGSTPPSVTCTSPGSGGATGITIIATCVSIQYAYRWQFGRVVNLLGSTISLPTTLSASAVAMNEN